MPYKEIQNGCLSFEIGQSKLKLATESPRVLTTTCNIIKVLNSYNLSFICPISICQLAPCLAAIYNQPEISRDCTELKQEHGILSNVYGPLISKYPKYISVQSVKLRKIVMLKILAGI